MTRTHSLATAALAASLLAGGLSAASAQTFTVNGTVTGAAPSFTYSYVVTPLTGSLGLLVFNFSDASVTPVSPAPSGFASITTPVGAGVFEFYSTITGGTTTATTFQFTSPDNIGGTLGATNVSLVAGSSGVASAIATGVAPAPEPSQTAALGLGVLGLSILAFKARKRQSA